MFILKIPSGYGQVEKLKSGFEDLSLAYKTEEDSSIHVPIVIEGKKTFEGEDAISALFDELKSYYGEHYNCSCAR